MRLALASLLFVSVSVAARPALACGGFFCSASPVDQNAEKIVFAVDEVANTTDMIVQIAYQGDDEAFAWVLPVGAVPQKREVFPALALSSFDGQTAITFQLPQDCQSFYGGPGGFADAGVAVKAPSAASADAGVIVHVMETVDVYDVAVIESESADASFEWLTSNGYRLSSVMKPYIELYTAQHMKFLALKLTADASAKDLKPFKMTLPGITPTIPLRLTAIAAEPEMGVAVWILGERRYEPADSEEIDIPKDDLRWIPGTYPPQTNWTNLVAAYVDARGGRGWVVESAGSTEALHSAVESSFTSTDQQMQARSALLSLLSGRPYLTRLYTRIAAEEMSYDPTFRRSDKPDVARVHELPFVEELCGEDVQYDACAFTSCGTMGLCRIVDGAADAGSARAVTGCACAPGSTARTTFDPRGQVTVTCQDQRMSFMNPGESDETGEKFADPCVGFSCGEHGACVAMNLTPTCVCEQGYAATGSLHPSSGQRLTSCVKPATKVPTGFYNRRPPPLAPGMVAGRTLALEPANGKPDVTLPPMYGEPSDEPTLDPEKPAKNESDDCSVGGSGGAVWWTLSLLLARRRRRS
jgi:hypothetical protein